MNKLPKKQKKSESLIGVPQDNVVDLRKTSLGSKQYITYNKEIEDLEKKQAKEIAKQRKAGKGFFARFFNSSKKSKTANKILVKKLSSEIVKPTEKKEEIIKKEPEKVQHSEPQPKPELKIIEKKEKKAEKKVEIEKPVIAQSSKSETKPESKPKPEELKTEPKTELKPKPELKTKKPKIKFSFTKSWQLAYKPLATFLVTCLILILPFTCLALYSYFNEELNEIKGSVIRLTEEAFSDIKIGSKLAADFNFKESSQQFSGAFTKFKGAEEKVKIFNQTVSEIVESLPGKGQEYKSAKNLLTAAKDLAAAAEDLTLALDVFSRLDKDILNSVDKENEVSLTEVIVMGHAYLPSSSEKINSASEALEKVEPENLPAEYRDQINLIKEELPQINTSLKQVLQLSETMLTILGHEERKRYLVVFQNNREMRATGGFLGSFGLMDIDQGQVQKIVIPGGGTYDLNGALKAKVTSPEPLHLVNPVWQIQDSNWWPDWPTSARKIEWFYNQSDGPTVDGVLALTPNIIEEMLELTGPIDMTEEYDIEITADNFYDEIQQEAEKKYDETRESKKIIADLTPKLLDKLFSLEKENALAVLEIFYNALREKQILLYFNDELLQEEMINLGWSGSIKDTNRDYLSVINTNISGGKTDAVIEEIIDHQAEVQADGSIINTVEVTRTHKGNEQDVFANVTNWDYMRFYVPEGSQFLEADGFEQPDKKLFLDLPEGEQYEPDKDYKNITGEIYIEENSKMRINQEFNKTVFGNWAKVEPGKSTKIKLSYKLPFKIEAKNFFKNVDTYSLLIQKQPGSFAGLFNTKLILPEDYKIKWRYPIDWESNYNTVLDSDKYLGVVIAQEKY